MQLRPGWLRQGLLDARREADAGPTLRERVRAHPSGFFCDPPDESLPMARNPDSEFWRGVLRTGRELESWPDYKLRSVSSPIARRILESRRRYPNACSRAAEVCS